MDGDDEIRHEEAGWQGEVTGRWRRRWRTCLNRENSLEKGEFAREGRIHWRRENSLEKALDD